MINALIGKKIGQNQKFLENGRRIPVTDIAVSDNTVVQVKTVGKDAYTAVQLGIGNKKRPNKSLQGHVKKAGVEKTPQFLKEVRLQITDEENLPKAGDVLTVETVFKPGDRIQVTGISKGKGFAGVVKRHGFHGGPKTHGQSDRHRAPGSIGQTTTPGRVYKGKRMAGHMGTDTVTIKNLDVVDVDPINKLLYVSGLVPGHRNTLLIVEKIGENKKFVPLLKSKEEELKTSENAEVSVEQAVESSVEIPVAEEMKETAASVPDESKAVVEDSKPEGEVKEVKSNIEEGEKKVPDENEKEEVKEVVK